MRAVAFAALFALAAQAGAPSVPLAPAFEPSAWTLPASAERAYTAVAPRIDGRIAMDIVSFMDRYWRIAANPGFNASIDYVQQRLRAAGLATRIEEFQPRGRGWDYETGTVAFADSGEVLLSRERDRVSLCINSFSTPDAGIDARLVDVGSGASAADYDGKNVTGAIVLGSAPVGQLWEQAVKARGAVGIVSTAVAPYIRPDDPATFTAPDQWDVLQWGSVPYDPERKAFGFKAGLRAATRMRARLREGSVRLKVTVRSAFYDGPARSLIAEIPGTRRPDERIVMVAHVQEPGANDDGSGCGTLAALAIAIAAAVREGALPPPGRTLMFMWADEVAGSRHWLASHADAARRVQYMFALDMTGEDTSKTGGTFLIEKQPDPSAVWPRPSDPHTAWGASEVKAASLKGSLLNDLHLAICRRRARDVQWIVRTNPYEGGSDHTAFGDAGIPSLLNWHFTDRYYHTNLDRPDKTSAAEMVNVGVAVATSASFLASASDRDALAVVDLVAQAAADRLGLERRQGASAEIMTAWTKWYREALASVKALPVIGPTADVDARVGAAIRALSAAATR